MKRGGCVLQAWDKLIQEGRRVSEAEFVVVCVGSNDVANILHEADVEQGGGDEEVREQLRQNVIDVLDRIIQVVLEAGSMPVILTPSVRVDIPER
jgi:hypothetical protein